MKMSHDTHSNTHSNFIEVAQKLVALDYYALEACEASICRIENTIYRKYLQNLVNDHKRHVGELNKLLLVHDQYSAGSPGMRRWIARGKIIIQNLSRDNSILKAMLSNKEDTSKVYNNMNNHLDKWQDGSEICKKGWSNNSEFYATQGTHSS